MAKRLHTMQGGAQDNTLWDRVEKFLKNNPFAVIVLVCVVALGGLKSSVESYVTVKDFVSASLRHDSVHSNSVSCNEVQNLKSGKAMPGEETRLFIVNSWHQNIKAQWIDFEGKASNVAVVLSPRQFIEQTTYPSHVWRISGPDGRCVGAFIKGTRRAAVSVNEKGKVEIRHIDEAH